MRRLVSKTLFVLTVLGFLSSFVMVVVCSAEREDIDCNVQLRKEIQVLNLVNGLYLAEEQMEFILTQAKKAEDIIEGYKERFRQQASKSTVSLEKVKSEVENQQDVSEDVREVWGENHKQEIMLREECKKEIDAVVAMVKKSLTDDQLYGLEKFRPCIVPPKGPARIGQSRGSHSGGTKGLERIRELPENLYTLRREKLAQKALERMVSHKPPQLEINESQVLGEILAVFDKTRSLSDIEFDLQKEELIKEFKEGLFAGLKIPDMDTKIKHFLLNPAIINVLEEKIANKEVA